MVADIFDEELEMLLSEDAAFRDLDSMDIFRTKKYNV